ncbi:MAG: hypothetical protein WCW27_01995 [Patescibacteria group bacterium]|jgi:hypothetical protein
MYNIKKINNKTEITKKPFSFVRIIFGIVFTTVALVMAGKVLFDLFFLDKPDSKSVYIIITFLIIGIVTIVSAVLKNRGVKKMIFDFEQKKLFCYYVNSQQDKVIPFNQINIITEEYIDIGPFNRLPNTLGRFTKLFYEISLYLDFTQDEKKPARLIICDREYYKDVIKIIQYLNELDNKKVVRLDAVGKIFSATPAAGWTMSIISTIILSVILIITSFILLISMIVALYIFAVILKINESTITLIISIPILICALPSPIILLYLLNKLFRLYERFIKFCTGKTSLYDIYVNIIYPRYRKKTMQLNQSNKTFSRRSYFYTVSACELEAISYYYYKYDHY